MGEAGLELALCKPLRPVDRSQSRPPLPQKPTSHRPGRRKPNSQTLHIPIASHSENLTQNKPLILSLSLQSERIQYNDNSPKFPLIRDQGEHLCR